MNALFGKGVDTVVNPNFQQLRQLSGNSCSRFGDQPTTSLQVVVFPLKVKPIYEQLLGRE
jgi:hypothetical protein